ncbi:secretin N-terminal domain-containing protein [Paucibacter sp. DJ2R-2]|uniref:secretin N-terminal domain-containing protein n=1 Tax=Paucibacter sp. DJ2R-2 TaxID=2893558 RepID=UPI0021E424C3|nr:secretin N-terminal domain-containing protein [Paucibacter sp. DJ2R-2]MCV2419515.1 general secretion pathway protein GspD [Paucibacter sp. DJ4R-1]MCV2437582.1 general secretion pathway protein GspD [Paucibacter sp. DJ2R-2]
MKLQAPSLFMRCAAPQPAVMTLAVLLLLAGCSHPALRQADDLSRANQLTQAYAVLDAAAQKEPQDHALRAAQIRLRTQLSNRLLMQIEGARASSRWAEAQAAMQSLREVDPKHPRLAYFETELQRGQKQEATLLTARSLLREGRLERVEALAREILAESPQHPGARQLLSQVAQARPLEQQGSNELGPAFQKPVTLEFRDAPLRQVFEALARSSNINFVFDKDVRSDTRITIFLRNVTLDEAMRVVLSTQQLDRKLLNDSSVLIFPNTSAKQREHQELITRTLYLANADVKQVQAMVRTIAKVRDIHVDERLNLMVVRDTPEVLRLVERLIASVDLPEPEVMLDVEVMELATDRVDDLGLKWPDQLSFGLPGVNGGLATGQVPLGQRDEFRGFVANPGVVATLRGSSGNVNLLANPKIRVRNREKAKVHIGQKLPVFTTTTNFSGQTSVAASVSYLDIGLKLDVEPTIQLDNDVVIKVGLEVSNLIRQVTGPGGTTAYEIGQRTTSTTLRLNDGETQVLAGLINDEDRRTASGIPGLSGIPVLGSLFGVRSDTRAKTEVVLLITPRIVRNLALPEASLTRTASGTDASPGAFSGLLKPNAKVGVGPSSSGAGGSFAQPALAAPRDTAPAAPAAAPAPSEATVRLEVTPQVTPGGTVSVTLRNESGFNVRGEVEFDASLLQALQGSTGNGRIAVDLPARGEKVLVLRALPAAIGKSTSIDLGSIQATGPNGESAGVRLEGSGLVSVEAAR